MAVGKIMIASWVAFIVVTGAIQVIWKAILGIHALPHSTAVALALLVIAVLWGGSFGYGMYLAFAVIRNGDRRLLRRGVKGTAQVLSRKMTNTTIQSGGFDWQAPRVYKYRLRVTLPGRAPYDTSLSICAAGIQEGSVVTVAAARFNRKRVTVDVCQGARRGASAPSPAPGAARGSRADVRVQAFGAGGLAQGFGADGPARGFGADGPAQGFGTGAAAFTSRLDSIRAAQGEAGDAQRMNVLAQLGQLHRDGVLTDAEFAAQKAQILSD